jgi:hypothetical protein
VLCQWFWKPHRTQRLKEGAASNVQQHCMYMYIHDACSSRLDPGHHHMEWSASEIVLEWLTVS